MTTKKSKILFNEVSEQLRRTFGKHTLSTMSFVPGMSVNKLLQHSLFRFADNFFRATKLLNWSSKILQISSSLVQKSQWHWGKKGLKLIGFWQSGVKSWRVCSNCASHWLNLASTARAAGNWLLRRQITRKHIDKLFQSSKPSISLFYEKGIDL